MQARDGEEVIDLHPESIKHDIPAPVTGKDEGEIVNEVRRIPPQPAAFAKCFQDKADMPLTQVSDTAMNELGTAARCAAAKIAPFEQQDRIAPRRGIDGPPRSRRTASNNDQVPRFAAIHGVAKEFSTIHADSAL